MRQYTQSKAGNEKATSAAGAHVGMVALGGAVTDVAQLTVVKADVDVDSKNDAARMSGSRLCAKARKRSYGKLSDGDISWR